jgi:hypothetical protein
MPEQFAQIVGKALAKNREERYQTAKDLGVDLKRLKQRLEFEAELERSQTPKTNTRATIAIKQSARKLRRSDH